MSLNFKRAAWRAIITGFLAFLGFWAWSLVRNAEGVVMSPLEYGIVFGVFFFIWTLVFGIRK